MPMCDVNFYSRSLGRPSGMKIVLPRRPGPAGVLYLLHGLFGDHNSYAAAIGIERLAEKLPFMVVMPEGGRGYYTNEPGVSGLRWEDHIIRDVVGFIDGHFQTHPRPAQRAVVGISMGGYGALMLGLRHADVFSAAGSMSGSLYFASAPHPRGEEYQDQLAAELPKDRYGLPALAEKLKTAGGQLAMKFDCGTDDYLVDCNRDFHRYLESLGLPHQYAEFPGRHDWNYWQDRLPEMLAWVESHVNP